MNWIFNTILNTQTLLFYLYYVSYHNIFFNTIYPMHVLGPVPQGEATWEASNETLAATWSHYQYRRSQASYLCIIWLRYSDQLSYFTSSPDPLTFIFIILCQSHVIAIWLQTMGPNKRISSYPKSPHKIRRAHSPLFLPFADLRMKVPTTAERPFHSAALNPVELSAVAHGN